METTQEQFDAGEEDRVGWTGIVERRVEGTLATPLQSYNLATSLRLDCGCSPGVARKMLDAMCEGNFCALCSGLLDVDPKYTHCERCLTFFTAAGCTECRSPVGRLVEGKHPTWTQCKRRRIE